MIGQYKDHHLLQNHVKMIQLDEIHNLIEIA